METIYEKGKLKYIRADAFDWLRARRGSTIHGVVTDPPFGLEYSERELRHRENGNRAGVWRLPPAFDGDYNRQPLPRFTVLGDRELDEMYDFFFEWAELLLRPLVPGAHVLVASNPLVSHIVSDAMEDAAFERRGTIIRTVRTLRGGDRPKGAEKEYPEVSVIPKSLYEPWLLFRKPLEGRISDNLAKWGTGGLRRPAEDRPFDDIIHSSRTPVREREIAPHWSLKPQDFLRQVVRAILPLGTGTVLDSFAGSGSTVAAAGHVGYRAVGVERDARVATMAATAIPALQALEVNVPRTASNGSVNGNGSAANGRVVLPRATLP